MLTEAEQRKVARFGNAYRASPLGRFRPWLSPDGAAPQASFVRGAEHHRKRVFRAGNKSGKTTALAFDALLQLCGWHWYAPERGHPLTCWASALDWEWGVGQDLWPAFRDLLPMDQVRTIHWYRKKEPAIPRTIIFRNGSRLDFKSADSGRKKYQGTVVDLLVLNEEHPADVVREARRGLVTRGGQLLVGLTPVERMRWVQDLEREPGTLVVRASMRDAAAAGIADLGAVEDYLASLPERQRALRELGDYADLEGAVYPEFAAETHVARPVGKHLVLQGREVAEWPLPRAWPRFAAWDFGYAVGHATAVLRAAHDRTAGRLFVERCWYGEQVRTSVWARRLHPELQGLAAPVACDHAANDRAELEAAGIPTVPATKTFEPGVELVARLLAPTQRDGLPALVLVEDPSLRHPRFGRCDATKVAWEFGLYGYPEDREGKALRKDRPVDRDNHALDGLRYLSVEVVKHVRSMLKGPVDDGLGRRLRLGW